MGQVPDLGLLPSRLRSQAERRRQRQGSGHSADELHCPHQCPAGTQEGGHGRELTPPSINTPENIFSRGMAAMPSLFSIPELKKLQEMIKIFGIV